MDKTRLFTSGEIDVVIAVFLCLPSGTPEHSKASSRTSKTL